jgi:ribosomal protein S18 acetylase RimI-like enzyme
VAVTTLSSAAEVLLAADHDPYVRGRISRPEVEGWAGFGAVAWRFAYATEGRAYLMTHGAPSDVARLLEALLTELRDGQDVTVPRGTGALLPAWVGLETHADWDFRWTFQAPPRQPHEADVIDVSDEQVAELLAVANPDASAQPGDQRVRRWVGINHTHRRYLVACAADTTEATGVGHLSSIAVRPDFRGNGFGAAVTSALMGDLFAQGCDVVTLGMYASNTAGRALYDRLGMHERGYTSGRLRIRSRW